MFVPSSLLLASFALLLLAFNSLVVFYYVKIVGFEAVVVAVFKYIHGDNTVKATVCRRNEATLSDHVNHIFWDSRADAVLGLVS